jgi:outer membrane protein OmpA-like peptidoglycan-associated protein
LLDDSVRWQNGFYTDKIKIAKTKAGPLLDSISYLVIDTVFHFLKRHPEYVIEIESIERKRPKENLKAKATREQVICTTIINELIKKGIPDNRVVGNGIICRKLKVRMDTINGKVEFTSYPRPGTRFRVLSRDYVNPKAPKPPKNFKLSDTAFYVRQMYVPANPIRFEFNKGIIKPESFPVLDSLAEFLVKKPAIQIEIDCHLDCRYSDKHSTDPCMARAEAIRNYLVTKGVTINRLIAKSYNKLKPIEENGRKLTCDYIHSLPTEEKQEEAHAKNRRIEFVITEL